MDEAYSIRQATLDDIDVILWQRRSMFTEMGVNESGVSAQESPFHLWVTRHMQDGSYIGWLATVNDKTAENKISVVGGAGLWIHSWLPGPYAPEGMRGYVCNVYTNPAHRGHGIAHRLVEFCIEECRRRRLTVVALHASDAGRPIYEDMGFKDTNELRMHLDGWHL